MDRKDLELKRKKRALKKKSMTKVKKDRGFYIMIGSFMATSLLLLGAYLFLGGVGALNTDAIIFNSGTELQENKEYSVLSSAVQGSRGSRMTFYPIPKEGEPYVFDDESLDVKVKDTAITTMMGYDKKTVLTYDGRENLKKDLAVNLSEVLGIVIEDIKIVDFVVH